MRIRTVLVEDEPPARERLRNALGEFTEIEIVGEADTGPTALQLIRHTAPHLVFLDVQIPVQSGIEVLKQLEERPEVIFTTAYDEYAIQAFELHAVDYLLKPYGRDRLREAVTRSIERIREPSSGRTNAERLIDYERKRAEYLSRLCVQDGYHYAVLEVAAIDCFKTEEGLVFAVHGGERRVIDASLTHLEGQLDPTRFVRIHRNAIVNLDRIEQIIPWGQGKLSVAIPGGEKLFVSRHRIQKFKKAVGLDL